MASVALEFGKVSKNYEQVFVYAVIDEKYENLIEDGKAEKSLAIMNSAGKVIRTLEFKSPVKQAICSMMNVVVGHPKS